MKKVVEFKSRQIAQKVAGYFYGVEVNNNCLSFTNFDKLAFDLAVGLEKLDASAYRLIGEKSKVLFIRLEFPTLTDRLNLLRQRLSQFCARNENITRFVSAIPTIQLKILFLIQESIYSGTFTLSLSYTFTLPLNPDPLSSDIESIEPNEFLLKVDWQLYSLIDMLQDDPLGEKETTIIVVERA